MVGVCGLTEPMRYRRDFTIAFARNEALFEGRGNWSDVETEGVVAERIVWTSK